MFTFINVLVLSALGLSLIPIVIHLLNRKKSRLVTFSTLDFLKALQKKKIDKLRIRQILLLALRTLILLVAVIAFARPVSKVGNRSTVDSHSKTSVVLVIDNSVGTSFISEKGAVIDIIKNKATQIIDFLKEGDEASILLSNGTASSFSQNFSELKDVVKNVGFGYFKPSLNENLFAANQLLASGAKNVNKEIYVLTNLQRGSFSDEAISGLQTVPVFLDCSPGSLKNIGITEAHVVSKIVEKNKPIDFHATLKNFGDQSVEDVLASVYLDGRRVAQSSLSIAAHDELGIDWRITASRAGFISGYVETDDDAFAADNRRYFHVYVPQQIRVLLVGNNLSDTRFLTLALNPSEEFASSIVTTAITAQTLPTTNLNEFHVVLFSNVPHFDDGSVRRLQSFLQAGGGVMIFPGDAADIANYNKSILEKMEFGRILGLVDYSKLKNTAGKFGPIDYSHPIMTGMFTSVSKTVELASPNFYKFFQFDRSGASHSVISFSTGTGFMEDRHYGKGDIIVFASAVSLDWNDWPLKGIFAPLMNRCVAYLFSQNYSDPKSFSCGAPIEMRIQTATQDGFRITDLNNIDIVPKVKQIGTDVLLSLAKPDAPGNYSVYAKNVLVEMFDLNIATGQSNFEKISTAAMDGVLGTGNYKIIGENQRIEEVILQSRYGRELWKWLTVGVLILLAVEVTVAQNHRWRKSENQIKNL
jgi:hypothetical protein